MVERCLYENIKIIEKTRTGFLLEFTPDLFRGRNDKIK
jgi:hypothetical protein